MRTGILKESLSSKILDPGIDAEFHAAASVFKELGARVEEVSVPMHAVAPAIFGAASRQGGVMGRAGRASGRRQVVLTDLYEKILPCTAATIDRVSRLIKRTEGGPADCGLDEYRQQKHSILRRLLLGKISKCLC